MLKTFAFATIIAHTMMFSSQFIGFLKMQIPLICIELFKTLGLEQAVRAANFYAPCRQRQKPIS